MAKENIYDSVISELILAGTSASSGVTGAPRLDVSSTLLINTVPENFSGSAAFSSTVVNIPTGYTVKANSHTITYPTAEPTTVGSTETVTGPSTSVILGAVGSTFTVSFQITLEKSGDPDIVIDKDLVLTSVLPTYFGFKVYEAAPVLTGLSEMSSNSTQFQLPAGSVGRIFVAVPTTLAPIVSLQDANGLLIPASSFTATVSGSHTIYQLNYDTQITGFARSFEINFS